MGIAGEPVCGYQRWRNLGRHRVGQRKKNGVGLFSQARGVERLDRIVPDAIQRRQASRFRCRRGHRDTEIDMRVTSEATDELDPGIPGDPADPHPDA